MTRGKGVQAGGLASPFNFWNSRTGGAASKKQYIVLRYMGTLVLLRYNPRHGNTHPVGLHLVGGAALSDTLLPLFQRTGSPCRGPGAKTTSTYAEPEGAAAGCAAHDRRSSGAFANPASQCGRIGESPVSGWICAAPARRRRSPRSAAHAYRSRREGVARTVVAPPGRITLGWSGAGRCAPASNARGPKRQRLPCSGRRSEEETYYLIHV